MRYKVSTDHREPGLPAAWSSPPKNQYFAAYFTAMSCVCPNTHCQNRTRISISALVRTTTDDSIRTDAGGWPPAVSVRKTSSAAAPPAPPGTRTTSSQLMSAAESGAATLPFPAATMLAFAFPASAGLPAAAKSHFGERPRPVVGLGTK